MAQGRRRRRLWDDEEKRQIVAQTRVPGVSVSGVARRYDVNANLVFKWLRDPRFKPAEDDLPSFLPVAPHVSQGQTQREAYRLSYSAVNMRPRTIWHEAHLTAKRTAVRAPVLHVSQQCKCFELWSNLGDAA